MAVVNFDIDDEVYNNAKDEAKRLGMPLSAFIRLLLKDYFDGVRFERKQQSAEKEVR